MNTGILHLPSELGGWTLECDGVEQAPDGGWDAGFISYTTQPAGSDSILLRVAVTGEPGAYEVGVAQAFETTYEEAYADDLGAALNAMVDLMVTYAPDNELLELASEMGSSPVMAR